MGSLSTAAVTIQPLWLWPVSRLSHQQAWSGNRPEHRHKYRSLRLWQAAENRLFQEEFGQQQEESGQNEPGG
jgi:hypothetical protein